MGYKDLGDLQQIGKAKLCLCLLVNIVITLRPVKKKLTNLTENSHRYLSNNVYSLLEMVTLDSPDNYLWESIQFYDCVCDMIEC